VPEYGVGLTDLVKGKAGSDATLLVKHFSMAAVEDI
jgi:hypothetical protein